MIFLELFLAFLKVGAFTFGGAYAAIPLIRETVLGLGWLTDAELARMIAVSESTPGPIMVNIATYVGSVKAGIPGALVATFAVVLPAFAVIVLLLSILKKYRENKYVKAILGGVKPSVIGIIIAVGVYMTAENLFFRSGGFDFDARAAMIAAAAGAGMLGWRIMTKKRLSPIAVIALCAALGMLVYGV